MLKCQFRLLSNQVIDSKSVKSSTVLEHVPAPASVLILCLCEIISKPLIGQKSNILQGECLKTYDIVQMIKP